MIDPHHRAHAALEAVEQGRKGRDPKVKALVEVIEGTSTNLDLVYAWDKFNQNKARLVLDTFMLADATYDVVRQATGIPMSVLQMYAEFVFDTSVFRDRLDRIEYVDRVSQYITPEEVRYYRAAMTVGADYIVWLLNGETGQTPKSALKSLMVDSVFRAQEHRGAAIDSEVAKAALNWAKTAQKSAADLQRLDPQDEKEAMEDLKLALGFEDTTINKTTTGAPKPEDILH